jgi:hypothetical protein
MTSSRKASIGGRYKRTGAEGQLRGEITFELREDCVYYVWRLENEKGEFLCQKAFPVSFSVISPGTDPFEYALSHALEALRRNRINRSHVYEIDNWQWI